MKVLIALASMHHGNTKKLVDAIAAKHEVEVVDVLTVSEKELSEYDVIGFASGTYGFKFHPSILKFAENNLPENKKVFFMSTNAMQKHFTKEIQAIAASKNSEVLGSFLCEGYNTFAFFGWFGGTGKGHPDEKDIENCLKFYEGLGID